MFKSKPEAYIFVKDALISECLQLLYLEMQIIAAQCRERLMAYGARFNFVPSFASFFPERVCFANPVYSTFHVDSTTYKLASRNGVYIAFSNSLRDHVSQ